MQAAEISGAVGEIGCIFCLQNNSHHVLSGIPLHASTRPQSSCVYIYYSRSIW